MDIERLFQTSPPHEPLVSLAAIVRDWKWRTAPGGGLDIRRDGVVEYCRWAPSWRIAVQRAVRSRDANGKHHNHQSKVSLEARLKFGVWISEAPPPRVLKASKSFNFDMWHDLLDAIKPKGIGPVTVYDVAVRTGAYMNVEPESLYLHAGVKAGWTALMGPRWPGDGLRPMKRVPPDLWPRELRGMRADDVEDFVCTYRTIFRSLQR